ncbi:MAG TPA: PTS sugar transporter subunit IIC [Gemmatimonadales bacterium]|nr:PTS sugar transporter subunit IIC [Gemmatimonadales bacterium]
MTPLMVCGLVLWGTVVAVDLVTVPQGLLSRPLVAATVAGAISGDAAAGLLAGMVLELYALEVLPIGASRYPDYGPASVAGGAVAALVPGATIGVAGVVALPLAMLGGMSVHLHRRLTARAIEAKIGRVAAGDARAIWHLQREGLLRDAARGVLLSLVGVAAVALVTLIPWAGFDDLDLLNGAVLAGGITAALGGALRSAGAGARRRLLLTGLVAGILVSIWQ